MLNVVTGQPGDGKTLYTITTVRDYKKECDQSENTALHGREVHYHGIRDISPSLGWHELKDPAKWMNCPSGSIIIIDEAQEIFPPKPQGSQRPDHYTKFATHRHHGFDIYLITQNAMNIDFRVRSMCNVHWHVSRNFGQERATIYQFKEIQNPRDYHAKKAAIVKQWAYPKEVYDLYKSAEVHTHKRRLPWKQIIIFGSIFLALPVLIYLVYIQLRPESVQPAQLPDGNEPSLPTDLVPAPVKRSLSVSNEYDPSQFKPAFVDLPHSAPAYQHLTKVRSYPKIDGCSEMRFGSEYSCQCNDQQGNYIPVTENACRTWIKYGMFDPYSANADSRRPRLQADTSAQPVAADIPLPF
jgi:zona occludens toxin